MLAQYLGATRRFRTVTVEVFEPRKGIVTEYVAGHCDGEGNVLFSVLTNVGTKTYKMPCLFERRQEAILAYGNYADHYNV